MSKFWKMIEGMPDLSTVESLWKHKLGDEFEGYKHAFLQKSNELAEWLPCPACNHGTLDVVHHSDGTIEGVSRCNNMCDDVDLTEDDLLVWDWNWNKAGRALAKAFGCPAKVKDLGMVETWQVAELGGSRLPIVVTIQLEPEDFRGVVWELIGRMHTGFVLLAPTGTYHDASIQELLSHAKAGFFDLDSTVTVLPNGVVQACKSGGELFSRYLPEETEPVSENEATRIFALMKMLNGGAQTRKASLGQVFRMLVLEGRNQEEVARACKCAPSLITLRVEEIEKRMGRSVTDLRQFASRLGEMNGAIAKDDRARTLYRRGLVDDTRNEEDE